MFHIVQSLFSTSFEVALYDGGKVSRSSVKGLYSDSVADMCIGRFSGCANDCFGIDAGFFVPSHSVWSR